MVVAAAEFRATGVAADVEAGKPLLAHQRGVNGSSGPGSGSVAAGVAVAEAVVPQSPGSDTEDELLKLAQCEDCPCVHSA